MATHPPQNYKVRVQVIAWYEVVVETRSRNDVVAHAEGLRPEQIKAVGQLIRAETGLADPDSVNQLDPP